MAVKKTKSVPHQEKSGPKTKKSTMGMGMTGADAVFAELNAMDRSEREEIAIQLLDWMQENDLG